MITIGNLRLKDGIVLSGFVMILASCAINDTTSKVPAPPITLKAPAALVEKGTCEITGELEAWLQVTVPVRQQFQSRLDEASAKNADDVHDDTLYLAGLLDTVAGTTVPDCGAEVQKTLTTAMSSAVAALQAYYNHTLSGDLATALTEPQKGLSQAAAIQNELITRMRNQYQLENNVPATPAS